MWVPRRQDSLGACLCSSTELSQQKVIELSLKYTDDTTLLAEIEEELKSLLKDEKGQVDSREKLRGNVTGMKQTDKGLSSQNYGFSSSHVWMRELDCKES